MNVTSRPFLAVSRVLVAFLALLVSVVPAAIAAPPPRDVPDEEPVAAEPTDPRAQEREELDRAAAAALIAEFRKEWRSAARETPARRCELLRGLAAGRHENLGSELQKGLKDKDRNVRLCAIRMLGTQPDDGARKALTGVAKGGRRFDPVVAGEAVRSLGYIGYDAKAFAQFEELFYRYGNVTVRQAVVEAVGRQKDKQAFSLLVSVLDQPNPANPNDPNAHPATYWKGKYDEWITYKDDVIAGLEAITGEKFYNSDTARSWAEKHGEEAGVELERTPNPWE